MPAVKAAPPPPEDEEDPPPEIPSFTNEVEAEGSTESPENSGGCGSRTGGDEDRSVEEPPSSSRNMELDAICTLVVSEPTSGEVWPTADGKTIPDELAESSNPTTESIEPGETWGSAPETEGVPLLSWVLFLLFFR
jgi:hypothetical protein